MTPALARIFRYPIKAHGCETLDGVTLTKDAALPWDRHWAIAHERAKLPDTPGWAPCGNFCRGAKTPRLMAISSRYDQATGTLQLRHPDRPDLTVAPDDPADAARLIAWSAPLAEAEGLRPARLCRAPDRAMTDTDYPSVSVANLASNAALGTHLGQELSPRRWRANLWLDGLSPWVEAEWIGRRLRIGEAELTIVEPIRRCMATAANPETGRRDADTLGGLRGMRGAQEFGLYARVTRGGAIATGATVEIVG